MGKKKKKEGEAEEKNITILENPANGAANNDPILCIKFMFIRLLQYLVFLFLSLSLFLFSLLFYFFLFFWQHFPILICIKINGGTNIVCVA